MTAHWRVQAAALQRRLGPAGLAGLAALGLAAVLGIGLTPAWQRQADEVSAEAAQAQALMAQRRSARQAQARVPAPAPWLQRLPGAEQGGPRLAALLEAAIRHGVAVQTTDQRLLREARSDIERQSLAMPVQARYADLRAFIETALRQDDALSLDSLRLHRAGPDAALIDAELAWSFHQQRGSAPALREAP